MKIDSFEYVIKKSEFNRYRTALKKIITHAKRLYYKNLFGQFKYDMKKNWRIISESLNKNSRNSVPNTVLIDGVECSDRKKIAEKFNSYFVSVAKLEDGNTDQKNDNNLRDYITDQINTHFTFYPIDNIDTKRMIKNVKLSNSKGHDGISSKS